MSSVIGNNIKLSIFGESHSEYIGLTIHGLNPGIKIDLDYVDKMLELRRPDGILTTSRIEKDEYKIISGYFNGFTTGAPLTILVANNNTISKDYHPEVIRPSTSDYPAYVKYNGFNDYRGSGMFSGRTTVVLVIAGAIARQILKTKNIEVASKIKSILNIEDEETLDLSKVNEFNDLKFPTVSLEKRKEMEEVILKAKSNLDSVGGIIETYVLNMPVGVGEPYFDSVESVLSHLVFSIPGVKGVEFGEGFNITKMFGSEANDGLSYEDGNVIFKKNSSGGINGGLSNGQPIIMRTAFRPTPSIAKKQNTINVKTSENEELELHGRHDPCFVMRARVVVDSVVALGLLDLISNKIGE